MKSEGTDVSEYTRNVACLMIVIQLNRKMQYWVIGLATACAINHAVIFAAHAKEDLAPVIPEVQKSTTFVFENDIFTGQDSGYTNGVALLFSKGPFEEFTPENVPSPIARLLRNSWMSNPSRPERARVYTLVQTMQTPEDLTIATLQEEQPPYAGILQGGISLYAFNQRVVDQLTLTLGVVGRLSLAEESQTLIHAITGSDDPAGWDNQLKNELLFQVEANRGYRLAVGAVRAGTEVDFIIRGGGGAGTIASYVSTSFIARFGRGLARTFPVASLLPNRQTNANVFFDSPSWYGFVGAEAQYVVNDIQINGNTFADSHSVPLDHSRELFSAGVSFSMGRVGLTFVYADAAGNDQEDPFGAVSVTYRH